LLNSRGEFEPFKLLIGAVTALLILTIIVSTINYFDSLELDISTERFYTGVKNAVNQPNDSVIAVAGVVMDKGMILSGGSSLLRNIDKLFTRATGVSAYVADDALFCVVKGTGVALEHLEVYKRSIMSKR